MVPSEAFSLQFLGDLPIHVAILRMRTAHSNDKNAAMCVARASSKLLSRIRGCGLTGS